MSSAADAGYGEPQGTVFDPTSPGLEISEGLIWIVFADDALCHKNSN